MVAPSLNIEDVLACVRVSRGWHAAWTQHNVVVALRRVFFPGLPGPPTFAAFREACHRYLRRRDGQFSSVSHHRPPRPDNLDDTAVVSIAVHLCYGDGIILWRAGSAYLILDDLRTRKCTAIDLRDWGFVPLVRWENMRVNETLIVCQGFYGDSCSMCVLPLYIPTSPYWIPSGSGELTRSSVMSTTTATLAGPPFRYRILH